MKTSRFLSNLTFLLSFCGFVYVLVLTQALSSLRGGTVLRYSLTIGLFLAFFEIGRFLCRDRFDSGFWALHVLGIETFLTLAGGFSVPVLFLLGRGRLPVPPLDVFVYIILALIAFLKGTELRLLTTGNLRDGNKQDGPVSAFYLGVWAASWSFVLVLFPALGLAGTAFLACCLNAVAGMFLFVKRAQIPAGLQDPFYAFLYVQLFLFVFSGICFLNNGTITFFLSRLIS